jgi:hypothetical protein
MSDENTYLDFANAVHNSTPHVQAHRVAQLAETDNGNGIDAIKKVTRSAAALDGFKSLDGLEEMLSVQLLGLNNLTMSMIHKASNSMNIDATNKSINQVAKLMRTTSQMVDTLTRYRTRGQQRISVVHVNGGQNVVGGNVSVNKREGQDG